ncbi:MAG: hypothetical protein IPK12_11095 [Gemmatimonadetes bacterium]|nr:hypothetical protein [Gemmatimonadota bacterium]
MPRPLHALPRLALAAALSSLLPAACDDGNGADPSATVVFAMDAPLCGTILPVELHIDSVLVQTDTFRINLAPEHEVSRGFPVAAGVHRLGARVVGGLVWPDTVVTLRAGEVITRSLPFYCS